VFAAGVRHPLRHKVKITTRTLALIVVCCVPHAASVSASSAGGVPSPAHAGERSAQALRADRGVGCNRTDVIMRSSAHEQREGAMAERAFLSRSVAAMLYGDERRECDDDDSSSVSGLQVVEVCIYAFCRHLSRACVGVRWATGGCVCLTARACECRAAVSIGSCFLLLCRRRRIREKSAACMSVQRGTCGALQRRAHCL